MNNKFFTPICMLIILFITPVFAEADPSPELLQWKSSGEYFEFRGHKIFYHDTNNTSENVIVMIHGFPTSSWDWRYLWKALQDDYRLVSLDMMGFGFSDKPRNKTFSIEEQVDLHMALLTKLGIKKSHILAHDYGTYVAQEMLARHNQFINSTYQPTQGNDPQVLSLPQTLPQPLSIQSLVILNGPIIPEHLRLRFIQKVFNSPFGWIASQLTSRFLFEKSFSAVFGENTQPSTKALNDDWFVISQQTGQKISHKLIHYYNDSIQRRDRWLSAIKETDVPVLSITGLADPVAGKHMVEKYQELVPDSEVIALKSIGHYPHIEDSKSVIAYYEKFMLSSGKNVIF